MYPAVQFSNAPIFSNSDVREQGINSMKAHGVMVLSKWPCEFVNYPYSNTTQVPLKKLDFQICSKTDFYKHCLWSLVKIRENEGGCHITK